MLLESGLQIQHSNTINSRDVKETTEEYAHKTPAASAELFTYNGELAGVCEEAFYVGALVNNGSNFSTLKCRGVCFWGAKRAEPRFMNAKFLDEIVFDIGTNLESNGFS